MTKYPYTCCGLAGVLALIGGCTLAPHYDRPAAPVPDEFPQGSAYVVPEAATQPAAMTQPVATALLTTTTQPTAANQFTATTQSATTQSSATLASATTPPATAPPATAAELPWRAFFTDERLQQVIALALGNNRDLRVAVLNVARAKAMYGIQESQLLPTLEADGVWTRTHTPGDLSETGSPLTSSRYDANLGMVAWEIDLFGRMRSLSDAAKEEFFATDAARRAAQIMLISQVADAYLTLAADRQTLQLAQDTLALRQQAYDLMQHRLDRGVATELDLYRAQAQVDASRRAVAQYTQATAQDENALRLLVGTTVPSLWLAPGLTQVRPPHDLAAGLSSTVLLERPDIVAAEHRLRAAYANIGAARAAFFPRISLTAAAGSASSDLAGLFADGSGAWSYGPKIVLPIFDPRVWYGITVSKTDRALALAQYEKAIQTSFREVADALAVRGTVDRQLAAQESLVHAVGETYRLSSARYDKGLVSYLDVLDAQRSLYEAQADLITLQRIKLANQVSLYAVLGGGADDAHASAANDAHGSAALQAR